jgi:hypothetical protein
MNRPRIAPETAIARHIGRGANSSDTKVVTVELKDARRSGQVCAEQKLAAAVLSRAADDLQQFRHARRGAARSLYADARKWIASNDRLWPYSFLNLCDALHLAADVIRAELLGNTSRHLSLNTR